jgi:hypothetical protein
MRLVFHSPEDQVVFLLCTENASLQARNRLLCEEMAALRLKNTELSQERDEKVSLLLDSKEELNEWIRQFDEKLNGRVRQREAEIFVQVHQRDTEFLKHVNQSKEELKEQIYQQFLKHVNDLQSEKVHMQQVFNQREAEFVVRVNQREAEFVDKVNRNEAERIQRIHQLESGIVAVQEANHLKTLELHRLKQCTDELKGYFTCTISSDPITQPYMLSTGQIYEADCIRQWLTLKGTCPNTGLEVMNRDYVAPVSIILRNVCAVVARI